MRLWPLTLLVVAALAAVLFLAMQMPQVDPLLFFPEK